ncbi:MAG: pentapeptide repeat-containing protein [Thermomicrobiales bacterium]|nr:pentapeptide repeat-containing protein [Thermomicrobiales bacterium]
MDYEQFDLFTRVVGIKFARRTALVTIAGGALLGLISSPPTEAGNKHKNKRRHKQKKRRRQRRNRRRCYRSRHCIPGPGQDNSRCDYSHSLDLFGLDLRGADLRGANLTMAQMAGANLAGANLEDACLVGANLMNASVDASTRLDGAIFCRTLMPDGSDNDADCGKGNRCCPAPIDCEGDLCPQNCIGAPNAQCSYNVPYGGCCHGLHCVPSSTSPFRTTCQAPCHEDGGCRARFGTPWICAPEPVTCRYLGGECCQHV